jgi:membrane-bound lytic murein transglycosylase D
MSFAEKQRFAGRSVPAVSQGAGLVSSASGPESFPEESGSGAYITYTVRKGDTLWDIARKYPGITETDIARLNNISNSSSIKPGQVIRIKKSM